MAFDKVDAIAAMTDSAIEALFWSESGDDTNFEEYSVTDEITETINKHVTRFVEENESELSELYELGVDYSQMGHDFILTVNGHGSGFFDKNDSEQKRIGDILSEKLRGDSELNLYIGDDEKVHLY